MNQGGTNHWTCGSMITSGTLKDFPGGSVQSRWGSVGGGYGSVRKKSAGTAPIRSRKVEVSEIPPYPFLRDETIVVCVLTFGSVEEACRVLSRSFSSGRSVPRAKARLLLMIDDLRFGGAQRQIVELAKNLDRTWIEPTLAVYHPHREYAPELESERIPIVFIPKKFKYSPWYLMRLTRYISRTKPDIIHSFMQTPNFWARVGGVLGGCPNIITSIRNSTFRFRNLERVLSRVSFRIIVNSPETRANLVRIGVPREKVVVIPNGVDTRRFNKDLLVGKDKARRDHNLPRNRKVFTLVGKFERQKNHDCLISAIYQIKKAGFSPPLTVFIGENYDPALKERLKIRVESLGLEESIRFRLPTIHIEDAYAFSDAIVLPSRWEGCANVVLEAFSCGLPVICSDILENRHVVNDGENGFLFRNDDPGALAACILKVARMGDEAIQQVGLAARHRAVRDFSLEQFTTMTMAVYSSALSQGNPSSSGGQAKTNERR